MTIQLIAGNASTELDRLPEQHVQTIVTSPPYYGLRDYGTAVWEGGSPECKHVRIKIGPKGNGIDGGAYQSREIYKERCHKCGARRRDEQLGLEGTPQEYVDKLVGICAQMRRVLRDDGILWLNIADSYARMGGTGRGKTSQLHGRSVADEQQRMTKLPHGYKAKDLLLIPAQVSLALHDDGWYVRSKIIWAKPNPMPESVNDRPTKSYEEVFLLTKRERYYYDAAAVAEDSVTQDPRRPYTSNGAKLLDGRDEWLSGQRRDGDDFTKRNRRDVWRIDEDEFLQFLQWKAERAADRKDVWTITPEPFAEAHYATMPPALAELCILAGSRPGDTVLDPFVGSGTTPLVSSGLGRSCIGIDLNPSNIDMAKRRVGKGHKRYQPALLP
jgi:DNA modification methylase